jgi:hypothetical protein
MNIFRCWYQCKFFIWAASWQKQHSAFATSMDPDQPVHPRSLIRIHAVCLPTLLTSRETDSKQHGSWSDCADAQAGLDPCWSQMHYVAFVMTRLNFVSQRTRVLGDMSFQIFRTQFCTLMHFICQVTITNISVFIVNKVIFVVHFTFLFVYNVF